MSKSVIRDVGILAKGGGIGYSWFLTGFLDCLDKEYSHPNFKVAYGVSVGAHCLAFYVANEMKKAKKFLSDLTNSKFVSKSRLFKEVIRLKNKIPPVNLEYTIKEIFIKKYKFNREAFHKSPTKMIIPLTEINTGETHYFSNRMREFFEEILIASASIPFLFHKPTFINNKLYADGGFSEPLPYEKIRKERIKKLITVFSDPINNDSTRKWYYDILFKIVSTKFPEHIQKKILIENKRKYYESMDKILRDKTNTLSIFPSKNIGRLFLSRNPKRLEEVYNWGYESVQENKKIQKMFS